MEKGFWEAIKSRRSFYSIENTSPISDKQIETIVNDAVKYVPSPFNSQSARLVLLLGEQHKKVWEIVKAELKKIVSAEAFVNTEKKINTSFACGYGTVLYFEDMDVVEDLQKKFESYKDNFPVWSHQSNGMHQFAIWTALEMNGLGASLQHYNPLIDDAVKAEWQLPASWKLIAQMPFGTPMDQPGEKEFMPIEQRVKIFK